MLILKHQRNGNYKIDDIEKDDVEILIKILKKAKSQLNINENDKLTELTNTISSQYELVKK